MLGATAKLTFRDSDGNILMEGGTDVKSASYGYQQTEEYGNDRMLKALNRDKDKPMEAILPNIRQDISDFVGNEEQFICKLRDVLKDTPKPPAGGGDEGMTLEKLKGLSDVEYNKFAVEHPDEFKALYEKGE